MRPVVYIAGPYRGDVVRNVQRAVELANHAVHLGYTPYVPHALGYLGAYGPEEGADDRAIECCVAMVRHVAGLDGAELWVITAADGLTSAGTQTEIDAWGRSVPDRDHAAPIIRTWDAWEAEMRP